MRALPDRLRAFVALRLNTATEAAIASFIGELQKIDGDVAWVRSANLHLTLRFLGGAVPATMLAPFDRALNQIGATTPTFQVRASGTGAFPNLDRPRVVWIGLSGEPLIGLAARVETAARECGFAPEPRPYGPHLTIGRVRHQRGWAPLRALLVESASREFGQSLVDSMILYRSVLDRAGAVYNVIARYPFQPAA